MTKMNNHTIFFLACLCIAIQYASTTELAPVSSPPPPALPPPVASSPCFSGMYNPCGLGSCINLDSTNYRCVCPKGTAQSTRIGGQPFCAPSFGSGLTYTVVAGDTCYVIAITFRLSINGLISLNPGLNCDSLVVGAVLNVNSPRETSSSTCWIRYTVTPADTCTSIRARFKLNPFLLSQMNPGLDCSKLLAETEFISVCIGEGRERSKFYICNGYKKPRASFSRKCNLAANARRTQLFNPGLYCGRLFRSPSSYCYKARPYNYLVCSTSYFITKDDSCATLYLKYGSANSSLNSRVSSFRSRNKGFVCSDRFLFVGQKICL